jgi:hypothetical protein
MDVSAKHMPSNFTVEGPVNQDTRKKQASHVRRHEASVNQLLEAQKWIMVCWQVSGLATQATIVASWISNPELWLPWQSHIVVTVVLLPVTCVVITYPANSYCSQANLLRQYTTVRRLMMVVWSKHGVAVTSEEEKKNCCFDGPIFALLTIVATISTAHRLATPAR